MTAIQGVLSHAAQTSAPAAKPAETDDRSFFAKHKVAIIGAGVGAAALAVAGVALWRHHSAKEASVAAAAVEAARLTPEAHAAKAVEALDRATLEFGKLTPVSYETKVAHSTYPALTEQSNEMMWRDIDMYAPSPEFSSAWAEGRGHANSMIDEILKRNTELTTSHEQAYNTWKTEGSAIGSILKGEPIRYKTKTEVVTSIPAELSELRGRIASWSDISHPYSSGLIGNPLATNITPMRDAVAALDLTKYLPKAVPGA